MGDFFSKPVAKKRKHYLLGEHTRKRIHEKCAVDEKTLSELEAQTTKRIRKTKHY
jgi:hypothetical protein